MHRQLTIGKLISRSLRHYWRTNLAVLSGVAIAVAVLSGALLVGQSVRESLRSLLFQRIGAVEYLLAAQHFFPEYLVQRLNNKDVNIDFNNVIPIIYLQGIVIHEKSGARALDVNVYGIEERFWRFQGVTNQKPPSDRAALPGAALAHRLGAQAGDTLLLRVETHRGIPRESLYGRREEAGRTIRLNCGDILSPEKLGEFSLRHNQGSAYSIFVPLARLQKDLSQPARINAILFGTQPQGSRPGEIRSLLKKRFLLEDVGIRLRPLSSQPGCAVESTRSILDGATEAAAFAAASESGMKASGVLTYLANSIRSHGREIPYSVISAVDLNQGALEGIPGIQNFAPVESGDALWLNEWAWRELGPAAGETVEVDYYFWQQEGNLVTRTARFRLAGIFPSGGAIDATLAPEFPGITDARKMSAWDPPFPLDLRRIRLKDEEYWDRHRATPKALVALSRGQELWQSRFGKASSVRVAVSATEDLERSLAGFAEKLRNRLDPEQAGFSLSAVKEEGLAASRGSTDFGEYFIYFSFFLIVAALLLSSLFFRFGIEQRVREIGTLQAAGFPHGFIRKLFLIEGALLSIEGSIIGLLGAVGYGWVLVYGLRTWWVGAVGTDRLFLHVSGAGLGAGAVSGVLASAAMIMWTLRGLRTASPRMLLSGLSESPFPRGKGLLLPWVIAALATIVATALLLSAVLRKSEDVSAFFGAGFLILLALLSLSAIRLRRSGPPPISGQGWRAMIRMGSRNTTHRPGRSLLCIALIASATFIIVSTEVFRRDDGSISLEKNSGTGGYPLLARAALPIFHDLNSDAGREAVSLSAAEIPALARTRFVPFRLRPGDDASCLNMYAPRKPRILGAPRPFVEAGRFSFQDSQAATLPQMQNPWLLLESEFADGAIPAIGDANTIQYILRLPLGGEITIPDSKGAPVRLRLVAALRDSIFQGELLISEANFLRAFADGEGYQVFLLDTPAESSAALGQALETRLADWGFGTESTRERLASYHRVENTYLSTFQSLGTLGLILGTAGLAAVLLRNVLERRKELALLRAVGFRRRMLSGMTLVENLVLLLWGLGCGTVGAAIAVAPAFVARGGSFPAAMLAFLLGAVLASGLGSSLLAVIGIYKSPLLEALQSE